VEGAEWQMENHLEIRPAASHEAPAIVRLLHDSFAEFKSLYTFAATTPGAEQILLRMREGPVWVALSKRALIGTVAAVVKGESAYIRGMAVGPSSRGSGTGTGLLQHVEDWSASRGCRRLFLSTTPFLQSAIRLYERSGFQRIDDHPQDLFGTPLFMMEKNISRQPSHPETDPIR
jgi:N-acetylglutamate synthase-like GNAT family acetyltransferase